MLTIEKNDDGTIEVWHHVMEPKLNVRVCTYPDKLAATLPRDELELVRELVNELDAVLPNEPVVSLTMDSVDTASVDSMAFTNNESHPAADDRLERV